MYSYARAGLYAVLLWSVTLLVAFFVYPLRMDNPVLFTSIRTLTVTLLSMVLTVMYFRDVERHFVRDGIKLGFLWLVVSIALDQGPYVWGLMRLSFSEYLADAGFPYLVCPIITIGAAILLSAERETAGEPSLPPIDETHAGSALPIAPGTSSKSL